MAPNHDRMPVILEPGDFPAWLGESPTSADTLRALLRPSAAEAMIAYPVSCAANNPANTEPVCVDPLTAGEVIRDV